MTNDLAKPESRQLDLFSDYGNELEAYHEMMLEWRSALSDPMHPVQSSDLTFIQDCWQEAFYTRHELHQYFDHQSPDVARRCTIEELVEAWFKLSDDYWCTEDALPANCDACGRALDRENFLTLSSGKTIHFGGAWGSHCWTYLRLVNERERDEAIAALARMGISARSTGIDTQSTDTQFGSI